MSDLGDNQIPCFWLRPATRFQGARHGYDQSGAFDLVCPQVLVFVQNAAVCEIVDVAEFFFVAVGIRSADNELRQPVPADRRLRRGAKCFLQERLANGGSCSQRVDELSFADQLFGLVRLLAVRFVDVNFPKPRRHFVLPVAAAHTLDQRSDRGIFRDEYIRIEDQTHLADLRGNGHDRLRRLTLLPPERAYHALVPALTVIQSETRVLAQNRYTGSGLK